MLKFKRASCLSSMVTIMLLKTLLTSCSKHELVRRAYDSALTVKHPVKGEMVRIPQNVKFEIVK